MDKLKTVLSGEEARRDDRTILEVKRRRRTTSLRLQAPLRRKNSRKCLCADCQRSNHIRMGHPFEGLHRLLRGGGRLHNFGKAWGGCCHG